MYMRRVSTLLGGLMVCVTVISYCFVETNVYVTVICALLMQAKKTYRANQMKAKVLSMLIHSMIDLLMMRS